MASTTAEVTPSIGASPVPDKAIGDYVRGCLKAHKQAQSDAAREAVISLLTEQAQSQAAGSGDAQVSLFL